MKKTFKKKKSNRKILLIVIGTLLAVFISIWIVTTSTNLSSKAQSSGTLKPVIQGLSDRQHFPNAHTSVVNSFIIKVDWSQIQPNSASDFDTTIIDNAISQAKTAGMKVKLRVYAGLAAPDWVKNIGGAPIPWYDSDTGANLGNIGRFWLSNYGIAYRDLHTKLSTKYDSEEVVLDVVINRCTTEYGEPFLRQANLQANLDGLNAAGYTLAADQQCLREQVETHNDIWKNTSSSLAFNPFQRINDTTFLARDTKADVAFTIEMMRYCRTVLGARCVIGNNSLHNTRGIIVGDPYHTMYEEMRNMPPPKYIQTATAEKIAATGDWRDTLQRAVDLGANMVELPAGYQNWPLEDTVDGYGLAYYDQLLQANPTPIPSPTPTLTSTPTPTPVPPTATPTLVPTAIPTPPDTTPPSVSITSPLNGATVARGTTRTISATASDNVGVTKVEFYVNGALKCANTTASYSCSWSVPGKPNVRYTLTARAFDTAGNSRTSSSVSVTAR